MCVMNFNVSNINVVFISIYIFKDGNKRILNISIKIKFAIMKEGVYIMHIGNFLLFFFIHKAKTLNGQKIRVVVIVKNQVYFLGNG